MLLDEKEVVEFMQNYLKKNLEMYTDLDVHTNSIRVVVKVKGLDIIKHVTIPDYRAMPRASIATSATSSFHPEAYGIITTSTTY